MPAMHFSTDHFLLDTHTMRIPKKRNGRWAMSSHCRGGNRLDNNLNQYIFTHNLTEQECSEDEKEQVKENERIRLRMCS